MESLTPALLGFLAGIALGAALAMAAYRFLSPGRNYRQLQRERDEAGRALERYRQEVDQHFLQSAEAFNQLDQAFRTVHAQLASGASRLCSDEGRRLALARAVEALPEEEDLPEGLNAPLDYAPSAKGTLAENFGLSETDELAGFDVPDVPDEGSPRSPPRDYADGCDDAGCAPGESERPR